MKTLKPFPCLLFIFFSSAVIMAACSKEEGVEANCVNTNEAITTTSSREDDEALLAKLSETVLRESGSSSCPAGVNWGIAAVGDKPCGGPAGYMAYNKANSECFLKLVAHFNQQSRIYVTKYGLGSDCSVVPEPKTVTCQNGKPVLLY